MFAFLYHIIVSHLDIVVRKREEKICMEGKNSDNKEKEKGKNQYRYFYKHPLVTGNTCCLWVIKSPIGNFPLFVSCTSFFVSLLMFFKKLQQE